jgi:hypothetical protein
MDAHNAAGRAYRAKNGNARHRRSGQRTGRKIATVTTLPTTSQTQTSSPPAMGPVETGVRAELANLPNAGEHPGKEAMAIRLAQLADDDENQKGAAASNIRQAMAIFGELQATKKRKMSRKLASVHAMAGRKQAQ